MEKKCPFAIVQLQTQSAVDVIYKARQRFITELLFFSIIPAV